MVISLAFLTGAVVLYFDFIKPTFDEIQMVKGNELAREQIKEKQQQAVEQVKKLLGTYQEQQGLQNAVSASLPLKTAAGEVIAQANAITTSRHMILQSVALLPPSIEPGAGGLKSSSTLSLVSPVSSLGFQLRVLGTYEDFKEFLKDLETNARITDVKEIVLSPAGRPDQDVYLFDVKIKVYYQNTGGAS